MRTDKTYSELWSIAEHEDSTVSETAKMAITTLNKLHEEIRRLTQIIERNSLPLYPCIDCGKEEQNPGLDVCGECYHKRITGHNY